MNTKFDADVNEEDAMLQLFYADMDRLVHSQKEFFERQHIFPYLPLRHLRRGCGVTSYLCWRLREVTDSIMVVASMKEFEAMNREYSSEVMKKVTTLDMLGKRLTGRIIDEIYFDNVPVQIMEKKYASSFLPFVRKKNSLILDLFQHTY